MQRIFALLTFLVGLVGVMFENNAQVSLSHFCSWLTPASAKCPAWMNRETVGLVFLFIMLGGIFWLIWPLISLLHKNILNKKNKISHLLQPSTEPLKPSIQIIDGSTINGERGMVMRGNPSVLVKDHEMKNVKTAYDIDNRPESKH